MTTELAGQFEIRSPVSGWHASQLTVVRKKRPTIAVRTTPATMRSKAPPAIESQ